MMSKKKEVADKKNKNVSNDNVQICFEICFERCFEMYTSLTVLDLISNGPRRARSFLAEDIWRTRSSTMAAGTCRPAHHADTYVHAAE